MKTVFVLGAGMVSRPLVHYLLEKGFAVTLGDINESQAKAVIGEHAAGTALKLDIGQKEEVSALVAKADLVVSLLPPKFHQDVAKLCLLHSKNFLTASYLSDEMKAMDEEVKAKGLIFLNEVGLDPGIDHMTAMEMIHDFKDNGYEIECFDSHCGGIPSKTAANNPLRYKLSWSPVGVLGAITRPARFRRKGHLIQTAEHETLAHMEVLHVPGLGIFESNPNGDSLYYGDRFGLEGVPTVRRGTIRYPGWSQFWMFMLRLDFVNKTREMDFDNEQVLDALFKLGGKTPPVNIYNFIHEEADTHASTFMECLDSLGFLDPDCRISGKHSCFSIVLICMEKYMQYGEDERDLVVLHHEMIARKDGQRVRWTSTMVREGDAEDTAMACLVGIPAAIAARLILEGGFAKRGVMIPIHKEIYTPILAELSERGLPHQVIKQNVAG